MTRQSMPIKIESPPTHNRSLTVSPTMASLFQQKMQPHDYYRSSVRLSPTAAMYESNINHPSAMTQSGKYFTPLNAYPSQTNYHFDDAGYAETDTEDTITNSSRHLESAGSSECQQRSTGRPSPFAFSVDDTHASSSDSSDHFGHHPSCNHEFKAPFLNGSHQHVNYGPQYGANAQQQTGTAFKCRQLPCRTFVSTGSCPYGDRCVFLHDPSIVSKPVYIKSKVRLIVSSASAEDLISDRVVLCIQRKSREDQSIDAFFWPTMSLSSVMGKVDGKNSKFCILASIVAKADR